MTKIYEIYQLGQSIWYDYIQRSLMTSGKLQQLIDEGLSGMTSNPTIFDKAISGSSDYDPEIEKLVAEGKSVAEIYDALSLADIAGAADLLRPVYEKSNGRDGFVSIEVNPELAHDTENTCREAKRIFSALDRPNIMIKVPATGEGFPAMVELLGSGINVNATLIFSLDYYIRVATAYIEGLENLAKAGPSVKGGQTIDRIASVASFFVSRVDTYFDQELEKIGNKKLLGKIAVANAKVAYAEYQKLFSSERWNALAEQGARTQRVLWASTSTKNPAYPKLLYVDELIGPNTVNTVPPATYDLIKNEGKATITLTRGAKEARLNLSLLKELGIDYQAVTNQLLNDGVESFSKSFQSLMTSIREKSEKFKKKSDLQINAANLNSPFEKALADLIREKIIYRLWQADHTIWKPNPDEITNRLGWLKSPEYMKAALPKIQGFVEDVRQSGFTQVLLLGMGGSSLAPEVFREVFGVKDGYLELSVLDSTDAGSVLRYEKELDLSKTLFLVSTKSGGTVETLSFAKYFYNKTLEEVGTANVGEHFVAITDPGSGLEKLAGQLNFRKIFLNDPEVGGRFSALTYFGLVPAALTGTDLEELLKRASQGANECRQDAADNSAAILGAFMGELSQNGKDKITFLTSPQISPFVAWVEQLIAESTGKEGKGILPLEIESTENTDIFSGDRIFVYLRLAGDSRYDFFFSKLKELGYPTVKRELNDLYDLGKEYFRWEFATAVAGWRLRINPFDQPNVEAAKNAAKKAVAAFQERGKLPELRAATRDSGVAIYSDLPANSLEESLQKFLAQAQTGSETGKSRSYISLQAYVQPTAETDEILRELRLKLVRKFRLATTFGYGPRFLHSTGQLHKGDSGNGLFIQIVSESADDIPIPVQAGQTKSVISFNVLKKAQSLGDRQALLGAGRKVLRLEIGDSASGLRKILESLD